ncbi:MAG TPA: hypothetical protein VHX14_09310 [Thermoanaerobaculia bacterium]|jgi:hypothetical protein|nr:hypothetical protein [Thermoanaerobaculia bacterium]
MTKARSTLSISECGQYALGQSLPVDCPSWPVDVFAVVGEILLRSGAYLNVVNAWPPSTKWNDHIFKVGDQWRATAGRVAPPPKEVRGWWAALIREQMQPLDVLQKDTELRGALLQLLAAADEASADAGLYVGDNDDFSALAWETLAESGGRTLCQLIDATRSIVLPKLHTPQTGLTFRSLSHHLALYTGGETQPHWHTAPLLTDLSRVLLLPWPLTIDSKAFKRSKSDLGNLPACYGFFKYETTAATRGFNLVDVRKAVERAAEVAGGAIDAVIFPELALREDDYVELCETLNTIVIGGLGKKRGSKWQNHAAFGFPHHGEVLVQKQSKHHRWRLDRRQIEQYGMEAKFSGKEFWWEHIELGERNLHFLNLNTWLTVTVLICEDLARQEPVSELVRAVGPTLAVALLMDGPQLLRRWPGRYAAVLADDPGTSVLTITSVGMTRLSHPKDGEPPSTVFALWNDAKSTPKEIQFKDNRAVGVVLKLRRESFEEWTADGRSDFGETSYLLLDGDPLDVVL